MPRDHRPLGMPETEDLFILWDAALEGIEESNLLPLAAYIEAGGQVSGILADELARHITWAASPAKRKTGPSQEARLRKMRDRFEVGAAAFIRVQRAPRAHQARVFAQVGKVRSVQAGQVEAAYKEFKRIWLNLADHRELAIDLGQAWYAAMREYCAEMGTSIFDEVGGPSCGEN